MLFAMGDMGWPAFVFGIAAFAMAAGMQRRVWRAEQRLNAIETALGKTNPPR